MKTECEFGRGDILERASDRMSEFMQQLSQDERKYQRRKV